MQKAAENGSMIMMHAENGTAIDVLIAQSLARGNVDPIYHGLTRPVALEEEATHRAIKLAEVAGCPLYVVHMSAREAVEQVVEARDRGANVFGETCPQYLYLNLEDHLGAPGFEGAKYVCSTPLRSKHEHHQADLWRFLRTNDLQVVSTDHCPFCFKEQKELGVGDFSKIPNGIGGVEHRMDLLYQGVVDGEISLERWVEVSATTPARMFGLYPQKGVIAPGSDADIVIYDPRGTTRDRRRDPPHEHGLLRLRGHRRPGQGRHRAQPRRRSSSRTTSTSASPATAATCAAACPATSGDAPRFDWGSGTVAPRSSRGSLMDIGIVLQTDPPASLVVDYAVRADELGFTHVWTFDSHVLWQEPYVIYSQILAQTDRVVVGPMVTNPGTRDWTVTASLFATLDEMFGHRTVCGIGRGDSARRVQGERPIGLAELSRSIEVIRDLVRGHEVDLNGAAAQVPVVGGLDRRSRSGWRRTGRRRCRSAAPSPTASSSSSPTPTSRDG